MGEELITTFTTALTSIQSDVMLMVKAALPVGLVIMGVFLAAGLGIAFFKSIAK